MKRYPYDYTGTLEANRFTETRKVISTDNADRVIILEHAPFFPNLVVKVLGSSVPLKEGTDYELVYQLTPLEQIASDDLFCGVQILSPLVTGELEFTGNTVGGDFVDPIHQILDMLVKHLNNPLGGKWEDVNGVPALMPKMATYRDWSDLLNTHYLATAIDGFADKIEGGKLNEEEAIAALRANVAALNAAIDLFDFPSHIAAKNPHNTNNTQINAQQKNLAVADTTMAYSKDFFALCDYVRDRGLTDAQIQDYLNEYVVGDIKGTFSFKDGVAVIESMDGSAKLDMNNGRITITTKGGVFLQADSDTLSATEYYTFLSGGNELKIKSSAGAMSHHEIYLNGHEILNNHTIKSYQGAPGGGASTSIFTESSTITLSGDGTSNNPITGTLIIPTATNATPGKARIKHAAGTEGDGWVAHPKAAKAVSDGLQQLVPDTRRINDKPLTGNSTSITKGDAKLGNVDNTADIDKPLSDDLATAVALLSGSNHTHNWSDLNVGHATLYDEGTALIAGTLASIPDNQGVAPKILNQIKAEVAALLPRYSDSLVATDLEFSSVSGSTFTIAGFTLTPEAPVEYMLSKNGTFVESTFSGTANLASLPNNNWMAVENDCEQRWNNAVIFTNAPNWPKPPAAQYISVREDYGVVGGVMGFKKRLSFKNTELIMKISADDAYTVYVDGRDVFSGAGSNLDTQDMVITPGRHTVAIEVRDGGGKGYTAFEIYDGADLIDVSDESWTCAEMPDSVEPANNRFFLYGDVTSGGFLASVTSLPVDSVSSSHLFIGVMETSYTQVKPNDGAKISFETTIDYGIFNELSLHYDEANAHDGAGENVGIIGLENVTGADICSGSTVQDMRYMLRTQDIPTVTEDAVRVSSVITKHKIASLKAQDIYHFIEGHCPAQYHCVKNVLADDEYTVEGILHARMDVEPATAPRWLFAANGGDLTDEILVIDPNDLNSIPNLYIEQFGKLHPSKLTQHMPQDETVTLLTTTENDAYGFYEVFPSASNADPYMFAFIRYRYMPRTNKLTVMLGFEGKYAVHDIVLPQNVARFFNKYAVGCRGTRETVFGGVVDAFKLPDNLTRRTTSYRALFEAYLSGSDVSLYAAQDNGITVHEDKYATPNTILPDWTPATELFFNAKYAAETFTTHGQPLPAAFCMLDWYEYNDLPEATRSRQHDDGTFPGSQRHIIPGGSMYCPDKSEKIRFRKIFSRNNDDMVTIYSGGDFRIFVDGHHIADGVADAPHYYTTQIPQGTDMLFEIEIATEYNKYFGLRITHSGDLSTEQPYRYTCMNVTGDIIEYKTPWHTCQAAWDKVLTLIANE